MAKVSIVTVPIMFYLEPTSKKSNTLGLPLLGWKLIGDVFGPEAILLASICGFFLATTPFSLMK